MTLLQSLQRGLIRAGLNETASTFKDKARDYWNMGAKDLSARKQWRWLFKDATITTTSGTASYDLADDVLRPLSFRNVTDDIEMQMVLTTKIDRVDPDADLSSGPEKVAVTGWNSSNTNWTVRLWPTPDTNSETIKYRYYSYIADLTSSNDDTELDALGLPDWAQTAMVYYVASQIMSEKGDVQGSMVDKQTFDEQIFHYSTIDAQLEGVQSSVTRLSRIDGVGFGQFQFRPDDGGLST